MHPLLLRGAAGLSASTLLAAPAYAASTTTTTTPKTTTTSHSSVHHLRWRDVAGVFTTKAAADRRMEALSTKGVTGFHELTFHTAEHPKSVRG
jgi:hypothetical protein